MRKPGPFSVLSSIRKNFFDNFTRANTTEDLGFADDGRKWDAVRGIFKVFENVAFSEDQKNYPLASVNMPYEDVEISLEFVDVGSGASLWVTDSGNWWGLGLEQEEVDCNCSFGTECDRWNQAGLCSRWNVGNCSRWNSRNCREETCASWNANRCTSFNATVWLCNSSFRCASFIRQCSSWSFVGGPCRTWTTLCARFEETVSCFPLSGTCRAFSGTSCASTQCVRWNSGNCNRWNTRNCNLWTTETCNRWFEFSFNCQKCYPQWIRIVQSLNTTIATQARFLITKTFTSGKSPFGGLDDFKQTTFINKFIQSIRIFVKDKTVKADLFYETNFLDKVEVAEEIIYTATGATTTPSYGILIVPSSSNQNGIIGSIKIDKN